VATASAQHASVERHYSGVIGSSKIYASLTQDGDSLNGYYYLTSQYPTFALWESPSVSLSGSRNNTHISLQAFGRDTAYEETRLGSIEAMIDSDSGLFGTWTEAHLPSANLKVFRVYESGYPIYTKPHRSRIVSDETNLPEWVDAMVPSLGEARDQKKLRKVNAFLRKNLFDFYEDDKEDSGYSHSASFQVRYLDSNIIGISLTWESDGGAYPDHHETSFSLDLYTGKQLTIRDLIFPRKLGALNRVIKEALTNEFTHDFQEPRDTSFFLMLKDLFRTNLGDASFLITPLGLEFNREDALPHAAQAAGFLLIPYHSLIGIVDPKSPLKVAMNRN
jgi:hypothetical protein